MPRIRQTSIVSSNERKRLFSPTLRMKPAKLEAAPVSVSTPMMTPTTAQATPTPSACLAPDTRLMRSECKVLRPPLTKAHTATNPAISTNTGTMPHLANDEAAMPSAIQNAYRKAVVEIRAAKATPSTNIAVSPRPTMPANIGVKPWNSM